MARIEIEELLGLGYEVGLSIEGYSDEDGSVFPNVYRVEGGGSSVLIKEDDDASWQDILYQAQNPPDENLEELNALRGTRKGQVLDLIARTDQWIIRAMEDGVAVSATRKQRRQQLRNILGQIDTATKDQLNNLQLPDITNVP